MASQGPNKHLSGLDLHYKWNYGNSTYKNRDFSSKRGEYKLFTGSDATEGNQSYVYRPSSLYNNELRQSLI